MSYAANKQINKEKNTREADVIIITHRVAGRLIRLGGVCHHL